MFILFVYHRLSYSPCSWQVSVQPSDGAAAAGQCQNEWPWPGVLTGFCSSRSSSDSSGHAKNDYVCTSRKVASATWVNARWNWQSILIHFGKSFLCVGSCVESAECPRQVCLMLDQLAEISPRSHCHSFRIPHLYMFLRTDLRHRAAQPTSRYDNCCNLREIAATRLQ